MVDAAGYFGRIGVYATQLILEKVVGAATNGLIIPGYPHIPHLCMFPNDPLRAIMNNQEKDAINVHWPLACLARTCTFLRDAVYTATEVWARATLCVGLRFFGSPSRDPSPDHPYLRLCEHVAVFGYEPDVHRYVNTDVVRELIFAVPGVSCDSTLCWVPFEKRVEVASTCQPVEAVSNIALSMLRIAKAIVRPPSGRRSRLQRVCVTEAPSPLSAWCIEPVLCSLGGYNETELDQRGSLYLERFLPELQTLIVLPNASSFGRGDSGVPWVAFNMLAREHVHVWGVDSLVRRFRPRGRIPEVDAMMARRPLVHVDMCPGEPPDRLTLPRTLCRLCIDGIPALESDALQYAIGEAQCPLTTLVVTDCNDPDAAERLGAILVRGNLRQLCVRRCTSALSEHTERVLRYTSASCASLTHLSLDNGSALFWKLLLLCPKLTHVHVGALCAQDYATMAPGCADGPALIEWSAKAVADHDVHIAAVLEDLVEHGVVRTHRLTQVHCLPLGCKTCERIITRLTRICPALQIVGVTRAHNDDIDAASMITMPALPPWIAIVDNDTGVYSVYIEPLGEHQEHEVGFMNDAIRTVLWSTTQPVPAWP